MRLLLATVACLGVAGGVSVSAEFHPPSWISAARCSRPIAEAADRDIDRLTNWPAEHKAFQRYKQCDDASIAEGYSDKIVILLTQQWQMIDRLAGLVRSDPLFGEFVLRHVDSLMSPEQGKVIVENARLHCPVSAKQFCRRLEAKARNPL